MPLEIRFDGTRAEYRCIKFSGGEVQPRIVDAPTSARVVDMICHARSSDDVMEVLLAADAVNAWLSRYMMPAGAAHRMHLSMPYLPYARQDRVCHAGEANGLKVMLRLLDSVGFDRMVFWDVHNPKAVKQFILRDSAWLNLTAAWFVSELVGLVAPVVIAPDHGARERAAGVAILFDTAVHTANKVRDADTGKILATEIHMPHQGDADLLMVDDICDGGRTFIELAKVLRKKTDGRVLLYVTHGIFSQGLDVFDGLIDQIYCPNVFPPHGEHKLLTKIKD